MDRVAQELGDRILLNSPALRIDRSKSAATVQTPTGTVNGKRVIVAIPPTLAGRILYDPPLARLRDQEYRARSIPNHLRTYLSALLSFSNS